VKSTSIAIPVETIDAHGDFAPAVQPLANLLLQLSDVVCRLRNAQYVQKPVGVVDSSVGGHVRHCLDHVRALLDAIATGQLNYDDRKRGTDVEFSRIAACEEIERLLESLRELGKDRLNREIALSALMSADGAPIAVRTSVGRELAYVLAHTVHHNALVSAMVKTLGGWLPERFGYAPSTLNHERREREQTACAR